MKNQRFFLSFTNKYWTIVLILQQSVFITTTTKFLGKLYVYDKYVSTRLVYLSIIVLSDTH